MYCFSYRSKSVGSLFGVDQQPTYQNQGAYPPPLLRSTTAPGLGEEERFLCSNSFPKSCLCDIFRQRRPPSPALRTFHFRPESHPGPAAAAATATNQPKLVGQRQRHGQQCQDGCRHHCRRRPRTGAGVLPERRSFLLALRAPTALSKSGRHPEGGGRGRGSGGRRPLPRLSQNSRDAGGARQHQRDGPGEAPAPLRLQPGQPAGGPGPGAGEEGEPEQPRKGQISGADKY